VQVLLPDGLVFLVPHGFAGGGVCMFDPATSTVSQVNDFSDTDIGTWIPDFQGAVLAENGLVVLVPFLSTTRTVNPYVGDIGVFNATDFSLTLVECTTPGDQKFGGGVLAVDGPVVFVPFSAGEVGIFDPWTRLYTRVTPTGDALSSVGGAYAGGVTLPDGRIVFVPLGASSLGLFNPVTYALQNVDGISGYVPEPPELQTRHRPIGSCPRFPSAPRVCCS